MQPSGQRTTRLGRIEPRVSIPIARIPASESTRKHIAEPLGEKLERQELMRQGIRFIVPVVYRLCCRSKGIWQSRKGLYAGAVPDIRA